jgi:DNA polymerase III epsilon subunit family exonuclease
MQNTVLVCFDTETTGLQPGFHQLVEIGAVKFKGDEALDEFQSLINPERDIPSEVIDIHGITHDMVCDAPHASEVVPKFMEFAGDAPLIAHNAPFDESFISFNLQNINGEQPPNPIYDTLILARKLYPELHSHSLANLAAYLDIADEPAHRSIPDVLTTVGIFRQCCLKLRTAGIETWEQFTTYYGHPHYFDFAKYNITEILPDEFKLIQTAIERGGKLLIEYIGNNSRFSRRIIVPESIFMRDDNFYLNAFCHLRCENRLFRLDRILQFESLPHNFDPECIDMEG